MDERCPSCGCVLKYRAHSMRISLATLAQQRAIVEEARAREDDGFVRERLDAHGYREAWVLSYACPGCGRLGSHCGTEYSQKEAETRAERQNEAAARPEATTREAADWKGEARRRAEADARRFADLLLSRFPEWAPYVRFIAVGDRRRRMSGKPWRGSTR